MMCTRGFNPTGVPESIKFLQDAVKWYTMSPAGRALSAIRKPFDLSLKDIVEKINECSRSVDQVANAAARAEPRDIHIKMNELMKVALSEIVVPIWHFAINTEQ
jgi:hypothetical protein